MSEVAPATAVDVDLDQSRIPLRWQELYGDDQLPDIDIGAGKARFLLELATARPTHNFLSVERSPKYHRLGCARVVKRGLGNVRLICTTAEDLLFRLLAPASVNNLFVLFPDPWPKKRHHKRRLFCPETVAAMTEVLRPGGRLLVKTDHLAYSEVIHEVLASASGLDRLDSEEAFHGLPLTGFECKYQQEGRKIHTFARLRPDKS